MRSSISLKGANKLKAKIDIIRELFPDEVMATVLEVALVDVETYAKREANIPGDTGRLRASIHTKYDKKPQPVTKRTKTKLSEAESIKEGNVPVSQRSYSYKDDDGTEYDGTLSAILDDFSVYVGTNVEYAKKINREGGGGDFSRSKLPKGTGEAFWDKAVENGRINLNKEMNNLVNRMSKIAEVADRLARARSGGDD